MRMDCIHSKRCRYHLRTSCTLIYYGSAITDEEIERQCLNLPLSEHQNDNCHVQILVHKFTYLIYSRFTSRVCVRILCVRLSANMHYLNNTPPQGMDKMLMLAARLRVQTRFLAHLLPYTTAIGGKHNLGFNTFRQSQIGAGCRVSLISHQWWPHSHLHRLLTKI